MTYDIFPINDETMPVELYAESTEPSMCRDVITLAVYLTAALTNLSVSGLALRVSRPTDICIALSALLFSVGIATLYSTARQCRYIIHTYYNHSYARRQ